MCVMSDASIKEASRTAGLVEWDSFSDESLKGSSYDLRVGDRVLVLKPEGRDWTPMDAEGFVTIPAYATVIVYTKERVNIPPDVQGRISVRSHVAAKGIYYPGGVADPGYRGRLFLPLTNLQDSPYKLTHLDRVASISFQRMDRKAATLYNDGQPIDDLPQDKFPPLPSRRLSDALGIAGRLDKMEEDLGQMRPVLNSTKTITELVIMGGMVGVGVGFVAAVFPNLPASFAWPVAIGLGCLFVLTQVWRNRGRR